MRLLLITNRYPAGPSDPASPFVPHFARAVAACDVTVDVLTPDYGHSDDEAGPVCVHRFQTGATTPIGSWNYLSPAAWLGLRGFVNRGLAMGESLCRDNQYDHILALWALPSGHFAQRLSVQFDVPYSVWCLGSDIYSWAQKPLFRSKIAKIINGAYRVFADGDDLCERIEDWLGITTQFLPSFRPLTGVENATPPQATDSPHFLYLGRLHTAKGVFELLEAFRRVRERLTGATLTYVGDGPASIELHERVKAAGLSQSVNLTGPVSDSDVVQHLLDCDIVAIPSRSDSIPLVLTEAVQANRPVIGSDVGDLGNTIRRYGLGCVTPSIEPTALAATMITSAKNPAIGSNGRNELLALFSPEVTAQTFLTAVTGAVNPDSNPQNSPATIQERAYSK